jgi:hypothetical protein
MTKNNKGRAPGKDATPKTTDSRNHTRTDHGAQDRRSRFEQKILLPWAQSQCGQTEKEER